MITSVACFPFCLKDQRVSCYRLICSALSIGFHGLSYNQADIEASTDQGMVSIPTFMSGL